MFKKSLITLALIGLIGSAVWVNNTAAANEGPQARQQTVFVPLYRPRANGAPFRLTENGPWHNGVLAPGTNLGRLQIRGGQHQFRRVGTTQNVWTHSADVKCLHGQLIKVLILRGLKI